MKVEYWVCGILLRNEISCEVVGRIIDGTLKLGDAFRYLEVP